MKNLTIAIHDDYVIQPDGVKQSFSKVWMTRAKERGITVISVDHTTPDFFQKVSQADAFMWRFGYSISQQTIAKRIIRSISHGLNLQVYPSNDMCWHFEDKIAQLYLLQTAGIPIAETQIFWSEKAIIEHVEQLKFPLVCKLASGIRSENVCKLNNIKEVLDISKKMFSFGMDTLLAPKNFLIKRLGKFGVPLKLLLGRTQLADIQIGYMYLQEYLPDNAYDTRVNLVGDIAVACRRFNRKNDFRASGSGILDYDQSKIDQRFIALAFKIARALNLKSLALDGLYKNGEPVIAEISYTFPAWGVNVMPGYWVETETKELQYIESPGLCVEEMIFDNFVAQLASTSLPKQETEYLFSDA
jgi:glutathione synthase/RimK-type ligase-like ATP-grasp enzyme